MCGIIGFTWNDRDLAQRMLDVVKHRGPDGEGIYEDKNITLGHRRLAVIDLETGQQPMPNEDESIWVFVDHPEWFHPERQFIHLTKEAIKKPKTRYKERSVLLSHMGSRAIRDLVDAIKRGEIDHITRMGWSENLKRAARKAEINQVGIVPKMTRKTWVSWLMAVFPYE